jgi:ornithine carbamoyltransferase
MKKDLISIADLTENDAERILDLAAELKKNPAFRRDLEGKTLALVFEKPSLRTRLAFEVGMVQLGGCGVYLSQGDIAPGRRESVSDIARNLERWVDGIAARTFHHNTVRDLASNSRAPVINALSDREHPCQVLADFLTIRERKGDLSKVRLAYLGDINNVCCSLMMLSSLTGTSMVVAAPAEDVEVLLEENSGNSQEAKALAAALKDVEFYTEGDPRIAVRDADVVYTDVWVSMGEEGLADEKRKKLKGYQVNAKVLAAAKSDVIFMHCLPAKRNEEVTDEVLDGPHSVVFDQAENRLHITKALLLLLLGGQAKKPSKRQRVR